MTPEERVRELKREYGAPDVSVAHLLCDRHPADAVAFTIVDEDLSATVLTYGELRSSSERFASGLAALGVRPGDRVATLMGKGSELAVALLGIWRLGAVHVPLFTAFAPPAIATRLLGSGATVVVCDDKQRSKLEPGDDFPDPLPWRVIVAGRESPGSADGAGDLSFEALLAAPAGGFRAAALGGEAPFIEIYTSGTTGQPKGVVVPTLAIASFQTYLEYGLAVTSQDVYWCAADPGWAYGLWWAIVAPLAAGVPAILLRPGFSAELTWRLLATFGVTNFAAAPTVYRSLLASGSAAPTGLKLQRLSSAGEPLTPEINEWSSVALGAEVHDHYGQTEAGMVLNNHHHPDLARPLRPGSMGQPMPGWAVTVLEPEFDRIAPPASTGRIAVDMEASELAWFRGYKDNAEATASKFVGDGRWYLTGDVGSVDEDGYFWFSARDDDVIIMAGYRIGPFEVESVLTQHPSVAECAVIAAPDTLRGEVLEAYVVLRPGTEPSAELISDLQAQVKQRFAAHAYPRAIHFVSGLPRTPSGKIQRFLLRRARREQGQGQGQGQGPAEA